LTTFHSLMAQLLPSPWQLVLGDMELLGNRHTELLLHQELRASMLLLLGIQVSHLFILITFHKHRNFAENVLFSTAVDLSQVVASAVAPLIAEVQKLQKEVCIAHFGEIILMHLVC
jgi:hypothetical protein